MEDLLRIWALTLFVGLATDLISAGAAVLSSEHNKAIVHLVLGVNTKQVVFCWFRHRLISLSPGRSSNS